MPPKVIYANAFTPSEKRAISEAIKPISKDDAMADYANLRKMCDAAVSCDFPYGCRTGNNAVDYYTFTQRLDTKGKYCASFYDFVHNISLFREKKFIRNMLVYYDTVKNKNRTKHEHVVLKEVYNICISAINIFRPIVAAEIYRRFAPKSVLDFTCGWGGRLVGACATNVPRYTGIDLNVDLREPYARMARDLAADPDCSTEIVMMFEDALSIDYSELEYDLVLTSPPYYAIEKYAHSPAYASKSDMNDRFYRPIIDRTYAGLQPGGHYCLNVNAEIYKSACVPMLGEAGEQVVLKKSKRQNKYSEFIYIWTKPLL